MLMGGMGGDAAGMNSLLPLLLLGEGGYTAKDSAAIDAICAKITDVAANAKCGQDGAAYLTAAAACAAETDATAKKACETSLKAQELALLAAAGETPSDSNDL